MLWGLGMVWGLVHRGWLRLLAFGDVSGVWCIEFRGLGLQGFGRRGRSAHGHATFGRRVLPRKGEDPQGPWSSDSRGWASFFSGSQALQS